MIEKNVLLKEVAAAGYGPREAGVYILYLHNRVMKVGSAKIGIQKRMQQYYDRNPWCGLNQYITENNKNEIRVAFQTCPKEACEELESKLFDKYGPLERLPWATRRSYSLENRYTLYI